VHYFPGSEKILSRHWFSSKLARLLEPIAVKNASLITGVAAGYYLPVLERNPHLKHTAVHGAMPYGGEEADHELLNKINLEPYLFKKNEKFQFVYAGAMLPKAFTPLEAIFKSIAAEKHLYKNAEWHFIGTGKTANDACGYNIKALAEKYGVWQTIVFEYPQRIPYLDVLVHLKYADGIFVLGSTEPHYTPSKIYQAVLSGKPLLAVLHTQSSAVNIIRQSNVGIALNFDGLNDITSIEINFPDAFLQFLHFAASYNASFIDRKIFEQYNAKSIASQLAVLLNKC
jgi:hypothetical protein